MGIILDATCCTPEVGAEVTEVGEAAEIITAANMLNMVILPVNWTVHAESHLIQKHRA